MAVNTQIYRSSLLPLVRQHASIESSQVCTDAELYAKIDEGFKRVYDRLVEARGQDYYAVSATLAVPATAIAPLPAGSASLPDDCYQVLAVTALVGGAWVPLRPFARGELARYLNTPATAGFSGYRYRLRGIPYQPLAQIAPVDVLEIRPTPTASLTVRVDYVPTLLVALGGGGDYLFDGINGWEMAIVYHAAAYALGKQALTEEAQFMLAMRDELEARIDRLKHDRDAGEGPAGVRDVMGALDEPWGWP